MTVLDIADAVVDRARAALAVDAAPNPFVDALEAGTLPRSRLVDLTATLYRLVRSDRRSFALAATRHADGPACGLFLTLAQGEAEALSLLDGLAAAVGLGPADRDRHEPAPLTQAYPAYLSHVALTGSRSDVALALLANVDDSGATYRRIADALVERYGCDETAVAHFRYLGDTPPELLDAALVVLADGLASGDDADEAIRVARTVAAFEDLFWRTMFGG